MWDSDDRTGMVRTVRIRGWGMIDARDAASAVRAGFARYDNAVASAAWHTVIDDAGDERFVDDVTVERVHDAIVDLRKSGYLSDTFGDTGGVVVCGVQVHYDIMADDDLHFVGYGDGGSIAGVPVKRTPAIPDRVMAIVDGDAVGANPAFGSTPTARFGRAPDTVVSPVVVTDPDGIVIMNVSHD